MLLISFLAAHIAAAEMAGRLLAEVAAWVAVALPGAPAGLQEVAGFALLEESAD